MVIKGFEQVVENFSCISKMVVFGVVVMVINCVVLFVILQLVLQVVCEIKVCWKLVKERVRLKRVMVKNLQVRIKVNWGDLFVIKLGNVWVVFLCCRCCKKGQCLFLKGGGSVFVVGNCCIFGVFIQ